MTEAGGSRCRPAQRGEPAGVEQGQPQAVEDRGHVLARGGFAAAGVGGGHRDAGGVEVFVGDRARWRAGDRGDLRQDVPLRRGVPAGNADPGTCFGEPAVVGRRRTGGRQSRPQIGAAEQFGVDGDAAGDHQPGGERRRLGDRVELLLRGQTAPAAGAADLGLAGVRRLGRRPARLAPRGPHRGQVVLDDRRVVVRPASSGAGITVPAALARRSPRPRAGIRRRASRWPNAGRCGWIRSSGARPGPGSPPAPSRPHAAG